MKILISIPGWLTLSNALDLILEKEKINSGRTFVLNGSANDQQDQSQSCNIWSCFLLSILATHQKYDVPFFFLCWNLLKKQVLSNHTCPFYYFVFWRLYWSVYHLLLCIHYYSYFYCVAFAYNKSLHICNIIFIKY